jgi:heat shock protein HslJ
MEEKMNKGRISLVFMFLLAVGFGSVYAGAQSIGGVKWELKELNGRQLRDSRAFIEFDVSSRRLSGDAGCNRFFGNYTLSRGAFNAAGVGATRRACSDAETMRTENAFLRMLERATSLTRNGNNLTLFRGGTRLARFRADAAGENADAELGSKKWMLTRIGTAPVNLRRNPPFLNFDIRKKSAGGNSGCNSFGGDYTLSGSTLRFGQMIQTMMACEAERRMTIEREFMDGLRNANRFELGGNVLRMFRGSRLLLEFEGTVK